MALASDLFSKANEAFVEENYEDAIELYTRAINEDSSKDNYYSSRAHAYLKLKNYQGALCDAVTAIELDPKNATAHLRKGIANFQLDNFQEAKRSFQEGNSIDALDTFSTWIAKCDDKIKVTEQKDSSQTAAEHPVSTEQKPSPQAAAEQPPAMPSGPKTRYDWYQTETHVIITVLLKNSKKEDVNLDVQDTSLSMTVKLPSGSDYSLELDLAHSVVSSQTIFKCYASKIEVKLKKQEGIRWSQLEGEGQEASAVKHFNPVLSDADTHKYPSSSHYTRNWDKLVSDIKKEEKDEKLEGDAALNQLFQQIYSDGSDEVKKAMNKSFVQSGGTVLSTNWQDIGKKDVEVKPPDGMEYKKYEY